MKPLHSILKLVSLNDVHIFTMLTYGCVSNEEHCVHTTINWTGFHMCIYELPKVLNLV